MPSVSQMLGLISKLESPAIIVHQERCVLVRNRNADCLRCAEVCTSGCIGYDGEELTIALDRCIECGTCATACPTCALEAHHPSDAQLAAACAESLEALGGTVCIACGKRLDPARGRFDERKVVRVECLGRVDESLLSQCAARGAAEVVLVHGDCIGCEHHTGRAMAERVCVTERALLDAWKSPLSMRFSTKLPAAARSEDASRGSERRALIEHGGREAARVGSIVADQAMRDALGEDAASEEEASPRYTKVMGDGTLPHFVPDRRERLLDALAALGEPEDVMVNTRLWGHVVIDTEACSSCRMCATFCPTGALVKFEDADGSFGVEHYPGDCVKCRTCAAICPAGAIDISEEVFAVDLMGGVTDRYTMKPLAVKRGQPHTIWHTIQGMTKTDQVYER